MIVTFFMVSLVSLVVASGHPPRAPPVNDGIHLAIHPSCGNLSGAPTDVNAGLSPLEYYKTIVAFGDSFTDGGTHDGGVRLPPVLISPHYKAGGRISNGPVWVENLGTDIGAVVKDYAISNSVTNSSLWPDRPDDLIEQVTTFLNQSNGLDPNTTLYTIFIGINDYVASLEPEHGPANLVPASSVIVNQIKRLSMPPTNARNFLIVDDTMWPVSFERTPEGDAFVQRYFSGLNQLHSEQIPDFRVGFVYLQRLWEGATTTPGLAAFGYTNFGPCVKSDTTIGMCSDPAHTFTWFPGHPSKQTHRIMADYIKEVLSQCNI